MSERIGTCEQCGQRYGEIPDSVTALKVKCQACGGSVLIPPRVAPALVPQAEGTPEAAAPSPAVKPSAKAKPLAQPLGSSKSKPVVRPEKAQPVDRKVAVPAAASDSKPVVPVKPAVPAKPVQAKASAAEIIAKAKAKRATQAEGTTTSIPSAAKSAGPKLSAAEIIAKAKAKRSAKEAQNAPNKPSASEIIAKAKAKRGGATAIGKQAPSSQVGATKKVSVRKSGQRRPSQSTTSSTRRRQREAENERVVEKSKAPLLAVGVLVLGGLSAGGWYFFGRTPPAEQNATLAVNAETALATKTSPAVVEASQEGEPVAALHTTPDTPNPDAAPMSASESQSKESSPTPLPTKKSATWVLPGPGEPINTLGISDAKLIELDKVPALEPWVGTSEAAWADIQGDLALFLEDSGAQSNRAGNRLAEDYPRDTYPAIVNAMMQVDFNTTDGMNLATALNDLLLRIGKKDLGWHTTQLKEPNTDAWNTAATFNKKVVAGWQRLWLASFSTSDEAWNNFCRVETEPTPPQAGTADSGGGIIGPEEDPFD